MNKYNEIIITYFSGFRVKRLISFTGFRHDPERFEQTIISVSARKGTEMQEIVSWFDPPTP
jgi:hypothetical protein